MLSCSLANTNMEKLVKFEISMNENAETNKQTRQKRNDQRVTTAIKLDLKLITSR